MKLTLTPSVRNLSLALVLGLVVQASTANAAPVDGQNVNSVGYAKPATTQLAGYFFQTGPKTWAELAPDGPHTFTEEARDAWSVYLLKQDGARVQLDLYEKKVYHIPRFDNSRTALYDVIQANARQPMVNSPQAPTLTFPVAGGTQPNGNTRFSISKTWRFNWTRVPGATEYQLYVKGQNARIPAIDTIVRTNTYSETSKSYIAPFNMNGWTWKVRAKVNGQWTDWSENGTFNVAPLQ